MKKVYITLFLLIIQYITAQNKIEFELDKKNNNTFFQIQNKTSLNFNDNLKLLFTKPQDKWYPRNELIIQAHYTLPINRDFGLGPSLFNQSYINISKDENSNTLESTSVTFENVTLAGLSLVFTPFIPSINKPAFFLMIDFGPGISINNNFSTDSELHVMPGGYSTQLLILPLMPIHLFILDMNLVSIMATTTPAGIMPGVRLRNHLIIKFSFMNFVNKELKSGLAIKNIFSHILTGKPFTNDLSDQYTYNKLFASLFWNGLNGLEINSGYGFEYITFARAPDYHIANKYFTEITYKKNNFTIGLKHSIIFWSNGITHGNPINELEMYYGYEINRF
ncbi:MAG: hypothetical protein A2015_06520 [Spirochaetes bacterium GWF1_31_7]|nr:MAG: hypothetical protein A2Y30_08355 [Spirochaetes bacterium GWE1_32_154]OHD51399.1 MAG: hypothetical protein A2Y29_14740 [Spirochaetes bacterium GWE2_31_10]OHD53125.1 MAG: hypothetical protein A2015_06520 [Spirochaetes bacterium GWF1_31_7]HBD94454.1 hypothetical protein [Spirochaetia bacterium]HBI36099.1 hypothetical protein [Spirochaetia bacterium]